MKETKKIILPKIYFPCGIFVESKQLKKLPDDMMLQVDASMLCAKVHACRGENLSYKPKRFREIYKVLSRIFFNEMANSYCNEKSDASSFKLFLENAFVNGVDGIFPVKSDLAYGAYRFCYDTFKMTVKDIRLFLGNDIPTGVLKLLPEYRDIALKREEDAEYKKNFVKLGSVANLMKKLSNKSSSIIFFDKNTDKLVIYDKDKEPWNTK